MQSKIKKSTLRHTLVSVTLSATTIMSFWGAILPVAEAQSQNGPLYNFTRNLAMSNRGDDVRSLQRFLNSQGVRVSASGPGSPGNETTYFGKATEAALAKWQAAHDITPSIGYFGPKSRSAVAMVTSPFLSAIPTPSSPTTTSSPIIITNVPAQIDYELEQASSGLPMRFNIPKITVDTTVEQTGLTPEGAMDIPKGPSNVAWFNIGPRPGEIGNAVIAGHFGWKDGIPAVFDNLHTLQKGDKIYIEDEKGTTITFVVRELRTFMETDDASSVFTSSDGRAHLNLVTCKGVWNKDSKSYSERLVVFTDKE